MSQPGELAPAGPRSTEPGPNGLSFAMVDTLVANRRSMPRRFAATAAGVSPRTFARWIQIGASSGDDPACVELARRIFQVEGQDVSESVNDLRMLRTMSAGASESYLKIMHPDDFGGAQRTAPDEFDEPERNRGQRSRLLEKPPPRMLAELRQYRWLQVPEGATAEEMASVEALIDSIRMRIVGAKALAEQT